MTTTIVAVDAMGGDFGPSVTIPAALAALSAHPRLHLILVGDEITLRAALAKEEYDSVRLSVRHASQTVGMDEAPSSALRNKKDSSLRVAINLVKEGQAAACVSAGNTGALMATARFVLKTLPGIDRPAIVATFPTADPNKNIRMLDLGANVDCSSEHLVQFAVMGSVLASAVENIESPRVALLNIGEEEIKGNDVVKQAGYQLGKTRALNYVGFVEGDGIYSGKFDVVVCDGFVGNVSLKTTEGVIKLITQLMKTAFMRNLFTKIVGLLARPVLKPFIKRVDPSRYNGATLIGLKGIVVKSHGSANAVGFCRAIEEAITQTEKNVPARIADQVEAILASL